MAMSKWVSVLIIVVLLAGTVVPLLKLYSTKGHAGDVGGDEDAVTANLALPDFATRDAKTLKAYEIASTTRKEDFGFLTCHCGCGMHAMSHRGKTIPKMNNLRDCFVRGDGTWEDHAAIDCPYCVDLAVMADDMLNKGYTLRQVRELIDTKYNSIAPSQRAMDMNPPMPQ
ncbi:TPA: hypothetical protein HA231_04395 [Candidatus Woesearchaeota archaeon]|nr:hypothetical protein [Candidatus Woesearchaeota archaeon]